MPQAYFQSCPYARPLLCCLFSTLPYTPNHLVPTHFCHSLSMTLSCPHLKPTLYLTICILCTVSSSVSVTHIFSAILSQPFFSTILSQLFSCQQPSNTIKFYPYLALYMPTFSVPLYILYFLFFCLTLHFYVHTLSTLHQPDPFTANFLPISFILAFFPN